jgi:hypothetical protein
MMMRTTSGIGVAGDDDAHHVRPALAHAREQLHPGGAGHALIRHHHLHPFVGEDAQRLGGALGAVHVELLVEDALHGLQRQSLVVHQQHGGAGVRHGLGRARLAVRRL